MIPPGDESARIPSKLDDSSAPAESTQEKTATYLPEHASTNAGLPAQVGRYSLEEEIARGGMGRIIRVHDRDFQRSLAMKVLLTDAAEARDGERFLREARLTGRLQHPGIPPVQEMGRLPDGRPFFIMKLVQGSNLKSLLRARSSPAEDVPRFVAIFEQICQTLAYAHSQHVIHRDLKPANIMVGTFGEVQVMDWGLAKELRSADSDAVAEPSAPAEITPAELGETAAGAVMGTPAYMAPEQARGEIDSLDSRCDVFGLGGVLCEILTGQAPFACKHPSDSYTMARREDLSGATVRLDSCGADAELVSLAKHCLAPQPASRPADAAAVAQAVIRYQTELQRRLKQAEIERAAALVKVAEERKRRRISLLLAASVLVLVLGASATAVWYYREQSEAARRRLVTEQAMSAALDQATQAHEGIQKTLRRRGGAFDLLNQPERWLADLRVAQSALDRAKTLRANIEGPANAEQQQALDRLEHLLRLDGADRELALRLESIRMDKAAFIRGSSDYGTATKQYPIAFAEANLGIAEGQLEAAAARISDSAIREQLVAALDDWAWVISRRDPALLERVLTVARLADPDPEWGDRLRDAKVWRDPTALTELMKTSRAEKLSPQLSNLVGYVLERNQLDNEAWLRDVQGKYPADFWLNLQLGWVLIARDPNEAAGFSRTALGIRPNSSLVYNNLGFALEKQGRFKEAAAAYTDAIKLDGKFVKAHINLGNVLMDQGRFKEAAEAYQSALTADPKNPNAHYGLGNSYFDQNRFDEAMTAFEKALELDPNHALSIHNRGLIFRQRGRNDVAKAAYLRAIEIDPSFAIAYSNLGGVLRDEERLDEAVVAYRKAIELDPTLFRAHYNLGAALSKQKHFKEAIASYQKAIDLNSKYASPYLGLGTVFGRQKRHEEEIAAYRKAVELDPKWALAYRNLGVALREQNRFSEAHAAYAKAVELEPRQTTGLLGLAATLREQKRFKEAVVAYEKVIALDPKNARAFNEMGIAFESLNRLDEAIAAYRKAVENAPKFAPAYENLGSILRRQKRHDEAIAAYEQAVASDPKSARYHNSLGIALDDQKRSEEAMAAYRKAINVDPAYAQAHMNLGLSLFGRKQFAEAIAAYRKAIELDPKFARAHANLGQALLETGEIREATTVTQKALELTSPAESLHRLMKYQLELCSDASSLAQLVPRALKSPEAFSVKEQLDLARIAQKYPKRCVTALRLYEHALKADSTLTDYCYIAALVALAAAHSTEGESAALDDKERSAMRRKALGWLQAELDLWRSQLKVGDVQKVLLIAGAAAKWRNDPHLDVTRDPARRAKLPEEEDEPWQRLWLDFDQLHQAARSHYTETEHKGALSDRAKETVIELKMTPKETYAIDLRSDQFDTYIKVRDGAGATVAENDDITESDQNSRLVFTPPKSGTYHIVVTSYQQRGSGSYTLTIRQFGGKSK